MSVSRRRFFSIAAGAGRSAVSLVRGKSRRKNITDALVAIDDQTQPVLKTKKYVVLKPNCVSNVSLVDLNTEARCQVVTVFDYHAHVVPVRLAARRSSTATRAGKATGRTPERRCPTASPSPRPTTLPPIA